MKLLLFSTVDIRFTLGKTVEAGARHLFFISVAGCFHINLEQEVLEFCII